MRSTFQAHFFDQCYPDSSMYGTHMILTNYISKANEYNSVGYNKLPLTSNFETYWDVVKDNPRKYDPVFRNFMTLAPSSGSGRPPHCLKLKVGLPIMLLKKVDGVCAGTRLIVDKLEKHVITAREGERVIKILRQDYEESTNMKPILSYKRQQFPVKCAFALAVDDVPEGVMFEGLGLDLTYDMTFPGQLHSALSRCRDPSRLKVYIPKGWVSGVPGQYTRNVPRVDKK